MMSPASKTILVVDDERDLLAAMSGVLGDVGYVVVECCDGQAALDYLATARPDAALIDMMMPVMSGRELVDRIRADPRLAGLPIIMMSAVDNLDLDRERIAGFLKKPFQLRRLLAAIRDVAG